MGRPGQSLLAVAAAMQKQQPPTDEYHEGVVVAGTWIAAEGVCQVLIGDTIGFENPDFTDGYDTVLMPICRIINPAIGDQYGPVGGERAVVWQAQCGWLAKLYHGPDDSQATLPAGERWISHRSVAAAMQAQQSGMDSGEGGYDSGRGEFDVLEGPLDPPTSVVYDSSLKLTNDGATKGDGLGGARLGNGGALTQSSTASGARHTIDDTAQKVESVTAGGMVVGQYDQVKQIVTSVVLGQLQSVIDGIAERIVHQASPEVLASIDAAGKEIALKVPSLVDEGKIGLGDFFENLPSASGAINEDILSSFGSNVNAFGLDNLIQFANLLHTAGTVTSGQLVTILTALIPAWIAKVAVPAGSGVVRIAN